MGTTVDRWGRFWLLGHRKYWHRRNIPPMSGMHTENEHSLSGRTVLVAGATGGIGEGMTRALLLQGARVVATGRDEERLSRLAAYVEEAGPGTLDTEVVDVGSPDTAGVRERLSALGALDGVVITIGDWGSPERTSILDTTSEEWQRMIAANLTSHFHALRTLTPLLSKEGALVHLSGFSAEIPYPFAALVGATNAAKKSLVRSLTAELDGAGPRIYELVIGPIRTRPRAAIGADSPHWFGAEDLGRHAGLLIAGEGPHADAPLQYLLTRDQGVRTTPPQ
ncbi:SDR family NAD(P)-dependent oxidoreductase [Streptomyces sp. VRA16 Mangrove soil]|uniref:SDR family NAD(P)-dependent oxidoreductase n=1 Tax=Streptomyces sp. VRA16 Mangrove soil TaxID=2817434 RepID=UPI001A9F7ADD|nr:SDR family oxidoreductase [Streptomyces sp. VRA16 Mangrove soil]MBO1334346.1 SDR family oxidoreductase [Streptomyces sp. VRA16 Mangrove soil]